MLVQKEMTSMEEKIVKVIAKRLVGQRQCFAWKTLCGSY